MYWWSGYWTPPLSTRCRRSEPRSWYLSRRRMSIADQYSLFNRYRLNEFFEQKHAVRRSDAYEQQRQALHVRARLAPPPGGVGSWGGRR